MCLVFALLIPFNRPGESFYSSAIYDLLFTEKLSDYAHFKQAMPMNSFIGPALITSVTRLFTTVFNAPVLTWIVGKLVERFPKAISPEVASNLVSTRMIALVVARIVFSVGFVAAFAFFRHNVGASQKSHVTPRILTLFMCTGVYCAYMASRLNSQSFSTALYLCAFGFLVEGQLARAFSCLAVNAAVFDGVFGSAVLIAAIPSFFIGRSASKVGKAMCSAVITFIAAAFVSFIFDSIFYNKFIWPQGEVILAFIRDFKLPALNEPEIVTCSVLAGLSAVASFVLRYESGFASSLAMTQMFSVALAPICGRTLISLELVPLAWTVILAFRTSADLKSSSFLRKAFAVSSILAALALPWITVPFIINTAGKSQYGAEALLALNKKIADVAKSGKVVRVHLDREARDHGYSAFLQVAHPNALYSTSLSANDVTKFRPDYYIRSVKHCSAGKAMKVFSGFEKFKLSGATSIRNLADLGKLKPEFLTANRLAVFRADQCEATDFEHGKVELPASGPSDTGKLVSRYVFGGNLGRVGEQRVFIADKTGRFSHKKIANMVVIAAYLYTTVLGQI